MQTLAPANQLIDLVGAAITTAPMLSAVELGGKGATFIRATFDLNATSGTSIATLTLGVLASLDGVTYYPVLSTNDSVVENAQTHAFTITANQHNQGSISFDGSFPFYKLTAHTNAAGSTTDELKISVQPRA